MGRAGNRPPVNMTYIILIILAGLNLSPFLFFKVNIWLAQGFWVHLGVISLFFCSFIEQSRRNEPLNLPLGLLFLWVAGTTSIIVFNALVKNRYDIHHFFQYFNFFCMLFLYKCVVQYGNERFVDLTKLVLKYTILFNLFIGVLQFFGISQFFQLLFPDNVFVNNPVVGMIGNGTHLSGFLAVCSPVLFTKKREDILTLVLMVLLMSFLGTTKGDTSISGFIILSAVALFYSFYTNKKVCLLILAAVIGSFISVKIFLTGKAEWLFFSDSGRFGLWADYWRLAKDNFITGIGLGGLNLYPPYMLVKNAYHMHLEYYHFLIELGVIGLILIVNLIMDFFREGHENTLVFKTIIFGFLVSCLFTYPAHLWFTSTIACISYAILKGQIYAS